MLEASRHGILKGWVWMMEVGMTCYKQGKSDDQEAMDEATHASLLDAADLLADPLIEVFVPPAPTVASSVASSNSARFIEKMNCDICARVFGQDNHRQGIQLCGCWSATFITEALENKLDASVRSLVDTQSFH